MAAPATAAANTPVVCVARYAVSNPPQECPITPTRFGSTMPVATTRLTAGVTHSTTERPGSRGRNTMSGCSTK